MDLRSGLNEILQVGARKEVAQVHEFAVVRVLNVDDTPAGLAAAHGLAVDDDGVLRAHDSERDYALVRGSARAL